MGKENLLNINAFHLNFLRPLEIWRILDLKSLRLECDYAYAPRSFERMIAKLQRHNVVKSFKDPLSNRKFIYLSKLGERLLGASNSELSEETMFHDSRVSMIVKELLSRECFLEFKLEHLIGNRSQAFRPDASLSGEKKGVKFRMAFELELTRKTKDRIKSKLCYYLNHDYYSYILYMFCNHGVMHSYLNIIKDQFEDSALDRVILLSSESLMSRKMTIENSCGYFKNKEVTIEDLF